MTSRYNVILMLSYIGIASFSTAITTPALPDIEITFKLGYGALEWLVSIFLLGYAVRQLLYGSLVKRLAPVFALRRGLIAQK